MNKTLILAFALCFAHNSFGLKPLNTLTSPVSSVAGQNNSTAPAGAVSNSLSTAPDATSVPQPVQELSSNLPVAQIIVTVQNAVPTQPNVSQLTLPTAPTQPDTSAVTNVVDNASQQLPVSPDDVSVGQVDPQEVVQDTQYALENDVDNATDVTYATDDVEDATDLEDVEPNDTSLSGVNLSLSDVINQVKELGAPVSIDDLSHVDKTVARLAIETILQAAPETPVTEVIAVGLTSVMANADNPVQVVGLIVQKFQESVQQNNGDLTLTNQDFSNKLTSIRDAIVAQLGH